MWLFHCGGHYMEQKFKVELEVKIPDEYVLITKVEYEELQHNRFAGRYWTMCGLLIKIDHL